MRNLIPILIFLIVIIAKVVRAVQEQKQSGGRGSDEGWWEDETGNRQEPKGSQGHSGAGRARRRGNGKPRPEPSSHVREILRQLQQQAQPKPTPAPAPAPPLSRGDHHRGGADAGRAAERQRGDRRSLRAEHRRRLPEDGGAGTGDLRREAAATHPGPRLRKGSICARAILISEILGPPRAFDV